MTSSRDLLGLTLHTFRLTQLLGEGGMATVYRGENILNPRIIRAIKVVHTDLAQREEFRSRFLDEASILEQLRHPNVVGFYGVHESDGWLVMELELLEGRPLSDRLGQALPAATVVRWMREACEGVAAAHALSIVHRDLKPDNLFLTSKGKVVVLDFGIARALDDADRMSRATRSGTVPGTPSYMAPEVCNGAVPGPAADVYALGICLFELLVGHHPFERPGQPKLGSTQMMLAHVKEKVPPVRTHRIDASEAFERVLQRATAREVSDRYGTAQDFADALRSVADGLPAEGAEGPSRNRTKFLKTTNDAARSGGRKDVVEAGSDRLVLGAGLAGSLVAAGGLYLALASGPEPAAGPSVSGLPSDQPDAEAVVAERNAWVRIQPPSSRDAVRLGLPTESSDPDDAAFRPSLGVLAPSAPYEMHEHEVTWGEMEGWLAASGITLERPSFVPSDAEQRESLPATGIPWTIARGYCRAVGGTLPTEEQWEWAARGAELRPYPWGGSTLDTTLTHAYVGVNGAPRPVKTSDQDRTPGVAGAVLYDMAGNAQEWTADLWREPRAGMDESWVQQAGRTFRAVRGVPLLADASERVPAFGAAYRSARCATGPCPASGSTAAIGFRCVRIAGATSPPVPTPMPELGGTSAQSTTATVGFTVNAGPATPATPAAGSSSPPIRSSP